MLQGIYVMRGKVPKRAELGHRLLLEQSLAGEEREGAEARFAPGGSPV